MEEEYYNHVLRRKWSEDLFYIDVDKDIKLKLLTYQDKEDFFGLIDMNRNHLNSFMPRMNENQGIDDTLNVIKIFLNQLNENNGFRAGIEVDGQLAGVIGLKYIDWINKSTEIMYWVDQNYLGRGIATKSTIKVLELAFDTYQLNKVILKASFENKASIRVARKCGFTLEGQLRQDELLDTGFTDTLIYSILENEYRGIK